MRISGWSSDVCSSDLIEKLIRKHFDLRPYGIIKMLDLIHPMYQQTATYGHFGRKPQEFGYVDDAGKAFDATASSWERTDREIGRASCRERVCQYVSIWVVAVSLTQKQKADVSI